jgi:uncharacterized protein (DUF58 family)
VKFENAVTVAASIAAHFDDEGARVQLVTAGSCTHPDQSRREQLRDILEMLARVQIDLIDGSFWNEIPQRVGFVRPDEVFKIVLTPAAPGSVPAHIWRTSHVIYFRYL